MATSEKVKICSACETKCRFIDWFWGIRGADLNLSDQTTIDDDEKIDIRTFDDYMLLNS